MKKKKYTKLIGGWHKRRPDFHRDAIEFVKIDYIPFQGMSFVPAPNIFKKYSL